MALTPTQLSAFRDRGYFNLGPVFSTAELRDIRDAYDGILRHALQLGERAKGKFAF